MSNFSAQLRCALAPLTWLTLRPHSYRIYNSIGSNLALSSPEDPRKGSNPEACGHASSSYSLTTYHPRLPPPVSSGQHQRSLLLRAHGAHAPARSEELADRLRTQRSALCWCFAHQDSAQHRLKPLANSASAAASNGLQGTQLHLCAANQPVCVRARVQVVAPFLLT